jgi:hypothetical protein
MSKTERCEEVLNWRKSSRSIGNGACVEAAGVPGTVMVRDTADRAGGQLRFPGQAWQEFTARIKGEA